VNGTEVEEKFYAFNSRCTEEAILATLPVFTGAMPKTASCLYNSGANCHMFNKSSDFETYETIEPLIVQGFGDEFSTTTLGHGDVRLRAMHGARSSTLLLTNVLHIPRARSNLISGTQLACHGIIATLRGTDVTLSLNGVPLVDSFVEHGMYHLNVSPISSSVSTTSSLLSCVSLNLVLAPSSAEPGFYTA
jgi:hypothetical protein